MRKINLIITFITILIISSCSSNEENIGNETLSIVGTWQLVEATSSDNPNNTLNNCQLESKITFKIDKTGELDNYAFDTVINDCILTESDFSYEINELKLIINENNFINESDYELSEAFLTQSFTNSQGNKRTNKWKRVN
jgi:hypothetical protein